MPTITINPELQSLIPRLTAEEYDQLERNIIEDGCHDKLIVWQETQTLLDGHNRYEICQRHHIELAGLTELSFPDLDAAKLWMIAQQFGRRNLTPEQVSNLRGTQYHLHKKMTRGGGDRKSAEAQDQKAQSEPFDNTADELAVQHKVSPSTIKRDAAYAKALKTIADTVGTDVKQAIESREIQLTKQDVKQLAAIAMADPQVAKEVVAAIQAAPTPQAAKAALAEAAARCLDCSRPLSDPDSIRRGIGPICPSKGSHGHGSGSGNGAAVPVLTTPLPADTPLQEDPSAAIDVELLLRTTAQCLEAIRDGLDDAAFAETFDQYGPLWDGVHDGCVALLDRLSGEPDEFEGAPEPISAPVAVDPPRREHGALSHAILQLVRDRGELTQREAQEALGISQPTSSKTFAALVEQGRLCKEKREQGFVYVEVGT